VYAVVCGCGGGGEGRCGRVWVVVWVGACA